MDQTHLPVDYEALLKAQAAEIAKRVSAPSGDMIRINQNKTFSFPDQTETAGPFKAVLVDFVTANYYYPSSYNPKDVTPPDCYALGTEPSLLIPSAKAPNRQSESCAVCPQNQWGSGSGNGKACRNHRLLALLPPDAHTWEERGIEEPSLMILRLSPTALRAFDAYVLKVARQFESTPVKVISEIGFHPDQQYPVVAFGRPAPNPAVEYYFSRMDEARKRLLAEPEITVTAELPKPKGKTNLRH